MFQRRGLVIAAAIAAAFSTPHGAGSGFSITSSLFFAAASPPATSYGVAAPIYNLFMNDTDRYRSGARLATCSRRLRMSRNDDLEQSNAKNSVLLMSVVLPIYSHRVHTPKFPARLNRPAWARRDKVFHPPRRRFASSWGISASQW